MKHLVFAIVAFFGLACATLAAQGGPVYVDIAPKIVQGAACSTSPNSGRVRVEHDSGKMWCCVSSQWAACGSSPVPGANTQVVFNDGGALGAEGDFTYVKEMNALRLDGDAQDTANLTVTADSPGVSLTASGGDNNRALLSMYSVNNWFDVTVEDGSPVTISTEVGISSDQPITSPLFTASAASDSNAFMMNNGARFCLDGSCDSYMKASGNELYLMNSGGVPHLYLLKNDAWDLYSGLQINGTNVSWNTGGEGWSADLIASENGFSTTDAMAAREFRATTTGGVGLKIGTLYSVGENLTGGSYLDVTSSDDQPILNVGDAAGTKGIYLEVLTNTQSIKLYDAAGTDEATLALLDNEFRISSITPVNFSSTSVIAGGGLRIGASGTAVSASYRATITTDIPSMSPQSCAAAVNVTVTNAAVGAECITGLPAGLPDAVSATCHVESAGLVHLQVCNVSGSPNDPPAGLTYSVRVFNP